MFRVGDVCTVDDPKFPGYWSVTKVNPKTIALTQGAKRLRSSPIYLTKVSDLSPEAKAKVLEVPIPEFFDEGQLVRLKGKDGVFVVTRCTQPNGFVRVVKLGGDDGRFWRCPSFHLTHITTFEFKEAQP
jgi:hypothetical protein